MLYNLVGSVNHKLQGGLMKENEPNFELHNAEIILDIAISSLASLKCNTFYE